VRDGGNQLARDLRRVGQLARIMDTAIEIPIIRVRLGLDALLGLVPGAGDAVSAGLAAYPVVVALRHRLPGSVIARLMANIAFDALAGTVPLLGDLFDVGFKANVRNQRLIERYADEPARTGRASRLFGWLVVAAGTLIVIALLTLSVWIVRSAVDAFWT
jgi:hypothetical protein